MNQQNIPSECPKCGSDNVSLWADTTMPSGATEGTYSVHTKKFVCHNPDCLYSEVIEVE